jgi:DNA-binding GntR family transcriptional regulator
LQDHLASEFQASHVPVREAFRRLEAQGLVTVQPNRGVRVAPLAPADVLEVSEIRAALEALALRHAIPRLTPAALRAARAHAAAYAAATATGAQSLGGIL